MTGDVGTGQPLYVLRYDEQQIGREISKSEEVMGIVNHWLEKQQIHRCANTTCV